MIVDLLHFAALAAPVIFFTQISLSSIFFPNGAAALLGVAYALLAAITRVKAMIPKAKI